MTNDTMTNDTMTKATKGECRRVQIRRGLRRWLVGHWSLVILWSLVIGHWSLLLASSKPEDPFYQLITLPIPKGIILEAGALQLLPDGKLACATRLGDIYLLEGAF